MPQLSAKEKYEKRCLRRAFTNMDYDQARNFKKAKHRFLELWKVEFARIIREWKDATAGD